jgi:hypothetical protein
MKNTKELMKHFRENKSRVEQHEALINSWDDELKKQPLV